ncbi:hypothetical protein Ade02nite_34380 [Paractinoplanes deccanensis]|uniref:Excreted virulence factor EspC (Type VII ESX diderm) n=1 Tax=Paractinoplanes deccanensis TaxID=113561 RepID=A0ABQ3Y4A2_9ACTN|nr:hypothetical protein [Actinoplanes deccanensis]GID74797.1 hypothetical protein Ade02nite_34380 [Actinoplanes deccanensis]
MTQPDIKLDAAALRAHARMVDEAGAMVGEAAAGAAHLDLHDEVYGEWPGRLFVPLINPAQDWALSEIRGGADATTHLAELLRAVADDADTTDQAAAERFRSGGK